MDLLKIAEKEKNYIVSLRRDFHKKPELSLHEKETSARVQKELTKMKIPFVVVGDYGVVATIQGDKKGDVVALRADMDALPVEEETTVDYKSQNKGVMHACGHDTHVAMLLGAAKVLSEIKSEINGSVKLCFQQAEEVGKCHEHILKELSKFKVKSVFGIHIWSEIPVGKVCIKEGPMMAGCDFFTIHVKGKGSHGAIPHGSISPIIAACSIVQNINSVRTYEINPLDNVVISIASVQSGIASNVIPETAEIKGSIRTFTKESRKQVLTLLERAAKNTAAAFRAKAEFELVVTVDSVINNSKCAAVAQKSLKTLAGAKSLYSYPKMLVSENFGSFLNTYPGVLAFVGAKNAKKSCNFNHHHPKFNIDEDALPLGSALYSQYAVDILRK